MAKMEPGDENLTLPDGLAVRDEEQYQREVVNLAGHIIAGDKPEAEFDRILRDSGSQDYANELASDAVLWVSRMALSDEIEITVVPVFAGRIQDFLVKAKFKIALWK